MKENVGMSDKAGVKVVSIRKKESENEDKRKTRDNSSGQER